MGARTNFVIKTGSDEQLVVYSHWGGHDGEDTLARAVKAALPRIEMGDIPYATRILVSQIVGSDWDSETGFGLYVGEICSEEEFQYKEIDLVNRTVTVGNHTTSIQAFLDYQLGVPA